jgi:hypothetical protein
VSSVVLFAEARETAPPPSPAREALADLVDRRREDLATVVTTRTDGPDWKGLLKNIDAVTPAVKDRVLRRLAEQLRDSGSAFERRVLAVMVHGGFLAVWAAERDGLPIVHAPAAASFAEPAAVYTPEEALSYWQKQLRLTDDAVRQVVASLKAGDVAAITLEYAEFLARKVAQLFDTALSEGWPLGQFRKAFSEVMPDAAKREIETLFRTEMSRSYGEAQRSLARTNLQPGREVIGDDGRRYQVVGNQFTPLAQWITVGDDRVRENHAAMHHYVAATEDAVWNRWKVPAGFNCFTGDTIVQGDVLLATRFLYSGEIVELQTRSGKRLSVTPNHPIATLSGFKNAGEIQEGDHVLSGEVEVESIPPAERRVRVQEQNPPARIDEVFRAVYELGNVGVLDAVSDDFHGDAIGREGQIDVACINSELLLSLEAERREAVGEFVFIKAGAPLVSVPGGGLFPRLLSGDLPALDSLHKGISVAGEPFGVGFDFAPLCNLRFGVPPDLNAEVLESLPQCLPLDAGSLEDRVNALPVDVGARKVVDILYGNPGSLPLPSNTDRRKPIGHGAMRDSVFPADGAEGHAGAVIADQVVSVNRSSFVGHVYDLQTTSGVISGNGIIASNCRCVWSLIPYTEAIARGWVKRISAGGRSWLVYTRGPRPMGPPPNVSPDEGF